MHMISKTNRLSNIRATQLLNALYTNNKKAKEKNKKMVMTEAIHIFDGVSVNKKDNALLNAMLKIFLHFGDSANETMNFYRSLNEFDFILDTVTFNGMMRCFLENAECEECLQIFDGAKNVKKKNEFSYFYALRACTQMSAFYAGKQIHAQLGECPFGKSLNLLICLISMYGKCGQLDECKALFDEIRSIHFSAYCTKIIVWNAMIFAFARNGKLNECMIYFDAMQRDKEIECEPDCATFCILLNVCNHCGDIESAKAIFYQTPNAKKNEKIICAFIDCLSRRGELEQALNALLQMEMDKKLENNQIIWMALIANCNKWKNKKIANRVYEEMKKRFYRDSDAEIMNKAAVLLANIYGSGGHQSAVDNNKDNDTIPGAQQDKKCETSSFANIQNLIQCTKKR